MFKRILNRSKDYALIVPGEEQKWVNRLKGKVSCLLYHRIEDYGKHVFLDHGGSPVTSPKDFDQEMQYLKTLPVNFYTLAQLHEGAFPDPDKIGVVICFDDCFKCNYQQGLEVLKHHSIPAVFFQCSGFINRKDLIWEHALYWIFSHKNYKNIFINKIKTHTNFPTLNSSIDIRDQCDPTIIEQVTAEIIEELSLQKPIQTLAESIYPTADDITQALACGHEIGSHGHYHYKRKNISEQCFEQELSLSQSRLTKLTGIQPISFSYPFDSYFSSDHQLANKYFKNIATVDYLRIESSFNPDMQIVPRLTWPGPSNNKFRMKRWLLTGSF